MHSNQRERLSLTHVTGNHILYTVISQFICLFTYTMISHHVDKMLRREQRGGEGKGRVKIREKKSIEEKLTYSRINKNQHTSA